MSCGHNIVISATAESPFSARAASNSTFLLLHDIPLLHQEKERRNSHVHNIHVVNPDIKVHTVISAELDFNHAASMMIPLGECRLAVEEKLASRKLCIVSISYPIPVPDWT